MQVVLVTFLPLTNMCHCATGCMCHCKLWPHWVTIVLEHDQMGRVDSVLALSVHEHTVDAGPPHPHPNSNTTAAPGTTTTPPTSSCNETPLKSASSQSLVVRRNAITAKGPRNPPAVQTKPIHGVMLPSARHNTTKPGTTQRPHPNSYSYSTTPLQV